MVHLVALVPELVAAIRSLSSIGNTHQHNRARLDMITCLLAIFYLIPPSSFENYLLQTTVTDQERQVNSHSSISIYPSIYSVDKAFYLIYLLY